MTTERINFSGSIMNKHFIQLKTACGCTRAFEVPIRPGYFYVVPLSPLSVARLSPDFPGLDNVEEDKEPSITCHQRMFRLQSEKVMDSGTIYEYVEVLKR